jgi:predicted nuclease of predicted toxin-antitoxin system
MKPIIVDMNRSPLWIQTLRSAGFEALHWSSIGKATDADIVIMDYARNHDCIVFTHDMDFGMLLALTNATAPSVLQIRTADVMPDAISPLILHALTAYANELEQGALLVIDAAKMRVRLLPLEQKR